MRSICTLIGGFEVYSILGILYRVDLYKELTRKAVFDVKISFIYTQYWIVSGLVLGMIAKASRNNICQARVQVQVT